MRRSRRFLPPDERRGLVLIDPPYESLDELKMMLQAFSEAYRRWPNGIFLMWYPIRSASQRSMVHARFEALRIPKMLFADLAIHPDDAGVGLAGSGLMIVNPPYGTDAYLTARTPRFTRNFCRGSGLRGSSQTDPRADGTIGQFFTGPRIYGYKFSARSACHAAYADGRCASGRPPNPWNR